MKINKQSIKSKLQVTIYQSSWYSLMRQLAIATQQSDSMHGLQSMAVQGDMTILYAENGGFHFFVVKCTAKFD